MSLQVWLPLNGNLNNQGLKDVIVNVSGTTTFSSEGKIGQCLSCNGSTFWTIPSFSIGAEVSICCWIKTSTNGKMPWVLESNANNKLNLYMSSIYTLNTGDGNNNPFQDDSNNSISVLTDGKWHHHVVTFGNSIAKLYIDGIYHGKAKTFRNPTTTNKNFRIAGGYNNGTHTYDFNGLINDLRVYDHCLSVKEVEEISKGLILHYKLDDIYSEVTTMLSCNITETAYNSPISKYGYNDNSNLIKTVGNFQGKECVKIGTRTAGQQAQPYAYFGNLFTSDGTNAPAYKALSFDYYTTVPTTTWLNIYKLGSGEGTATWKTTNSDGIYSGIYTNSANAIIVKPNEWNHIEVVFHGTTSANAEWGYCINGPTHTSNADYYFLYANIQLEQNDHVTGYGNNFHSSTIYDSSGYGNHGISISSPTSSNNTIRYKNSLLFDGIDDAIQFPYNQINPSGIFTVNLWFYKSELGSKNYETLFGGPSGFEMDTRSGSSTTLSLYMASTRGGNVFSPFELNTWYMVTMVRDGTNELYYINGNLVKTIEAKPMPTGTYYIGAWNVSTSQNYKGNISDFRLYATVLTEEQIKELYNASATIDNNGNIYSRGFIENDSLNITKTGLFQTSTIEDDNNGQASIFKTKKILGTNLYEY